MQTSKKIRSSIWKKDQFGYGQKRGYASTMECVRTIFEKQGSTGFYRGVVPPMLAVGVQKSVAFGAYESFK